MHSKRSLNRSHLFTLRLWPEDMGDGRIEWRGREVPGIYEIKLLGPDQLQFELQKDLCGLRRAQFGVAWNRVSP